MNRMLFVIIIGLGGAAILVSLGIWQVQRLAWKQGVIAQIEARIDGAPMALPKNPDPVADAYLPVEISGRFAADTLRVLVSQKNIGAGYRLISVLESDAGRLLVDRGFVPTGQTDTVAPQGPVTVTGNLQWPQETDGFTPDPDFSNNVWFARDVPAMADALNTREVLVVARSVSPVDAGVSPLPVDTSRIPNDHLQYAITWFSLAIVWLAMSLLFLRRRRSQPLES